MADTSRRRSRKTKLVPRVYPCDEDDLDLQSLTAKLSKRTKKQNLKKDKNVPVPQPSTSKQGEVDTSVLKKIHASVRKDEAEEISPRKFEVNIEIETCDGDDDAFAELEEQFPLLRADNIVQETNPTPIPLTLEIILNAADKLNTSTNIADKILNLYVRNTIGYEHIINVAPGFHENHIQDTLEEWRTWQSRSFHREDPLFYKCYICTRSYWYLSEFRDHLSSEHAGDLNVSVTLEKYDLHEANIIAYRKKLVVIKDIYTPGLCYRCGKDYAAHELSSRIAEKYYKAEGCTRNFFCCTGLRDHLPLCKMCNVQGKLFKCDICKSMYDTQEDMDNHLVLSHSVRSDIPIMARYTFCTKCCEKYECKYLHVCSKKGLGPNSECPHCLMSFQNALTLEKHMKRSRKPYKCEVCHIEIAFNCQKYDHMLSHTKNFKKVKKCMLCKGFKVFVNEEDAKAHWSKKHKALDLQCQIYFPNVFVPASCVNQMSAETVPESLSDEEESPEVQETVPKDVASEEEQESQSEDEDLIRKELAMEEEDLEIKDEFEPEPTMQNDKGVVSEHLRDTTEVIMDDVVVKEEPEDFEDSPKLVIKEEQLEVEYDMLEQGTIKEEPLEEVEYEMLEQDEILDNFDGQKVTIKQEAEEELDEYEGDIIKLNFNIEDYLIKKESIDEDEQIVDVLSSEDGDNLEKESQASQKMFEPDILIAGGKRMNRLYKCKKCGFQARHKQYREHIDYDCNYANAFAMKYTTYTCTKCNTRFTTMKRYLQHFEQVHGFGTKSCMDCLKTFVNFTSLGQHVQSHIKQNFVRVKLITSAGDALEAPNYQCKKCAETVASNSFFEHWESHIKGQPTHPVKVTSGPDTARKQGQMHESIIKECIARLYRHPKECNHCHRMFNRVNECKRHIIEHLLVDAYNQKQIYQELKCQICEKGFPSSDKYKQHMRDHASLPVYKCEICDRSFSDSSNFTKHKKVHNLKVIICDLCGKKFQSKMSLEKHIEKHRNTEPISCSYCDKLFYFASTHRRHVKYFHEKPADNRFGCVICGTRFDSLKMKWNHMWEVHKERKQKADCPICHKSYRKYSDVRAHARETHNMEVSVLSVKKGSQTLKSRDGINRILNRSMTAMRVNQIETLVVYDSD